MLKNRREVCRPAAAAMFTGCLVLTSGALARDLANVDALDKVLDLVEDACDGLLQKLQRGEITASRG